MTTGRAGFVVPWVVRWTDEQPVAMHGNVHQGRLSLIDERPEDRDSFGVLWQRYDGAPAGQPDLGRIHPARQRQAMDQLLCQVCSDSVVVQSRSTWLQPAEYLRRSPSQAGPGLHGREIWTMHAPICRACLPIAQAHCPRIRRTPWVTLDVPVVRPIGFLGRVFDEDSHEPVFDGFVPLESPIARRAIARARIVALAGFR